MNMNTSDRVKPISGSGSVLLGQMTVYLPKGSTGSLIVFDDSGKVVGTFQADKPDTPQTFSHDLQAGEYHLLFMPNSGVENSLLAVSGLLIV